MSFIPNQTKSHDLKEKRNARYKRIFIIFLFLTILLNLRCSQNSESPADQSVSPAELKPNKVVGLGRIEPELKLLNLHSEVPGIVTKIPYQPGENISQGEIIIELSNAVEKARLEQAIAKVQTQSFQVKAAEASLSAMKIRTANAKLNFDRAKKLYETNVQTQSSYDQAKTEYESMLEDIKRLEAEVNSAKNVLRQSLADEKLARAEFDRKFTKAPVDGQILSLDITLGSLLNPEKSFGMFAPSSPLTAWCEIDELFAGDVYLEQKAYIRYEGGTDPLAWGKVSFVGPYLRKKSIFSDDIGDLEDRRIREVRIALEPDTKLLLGSRIECVILLNE